MAVVDILVYLFCSLTRRLDFKYRWLYVELLKFLGTSQVLLWSTIYKNYAD